MPDSTIVEKWLDIVGRGRQAPQEQSDDDLEAVNRENENVNAAIKSAIADPDNQAAIFGLIDDFAAESLAATMQYRADHAVMLGHLGAYARLQDLKGELARLAGLTED